MLLDVLALNGAPMRLTFVFAALLTAGHALAQEPFTAPSVVLATLQSETLIPRRTNATCETFLGSDEPADKRSICVSNSCGFGEAIFRVEASLVGNSVANGALRYRLSEWCEPAFPLTRDAVLVAVDAYDAAAGEHAFRYERTFQTEDGSRYFIPETITQIGGIELGTLAKPLEETLVYGDVADFAPGEIERLLSRGLVKAVDGALVAESGVFVADLVDVLQKR